MSKRQGADSAGEKDYASKISDKREFDSTKPCVAVTSGVPASATLISENNTNNNTQKTTGNNPSNTNMADSVLSSPSVCHQTVQSVEDGELTNIKPAGGDVKEDSGVIPSQNDGAILRSKKGKGVHHLPDCEVLSQKLLGKDGHIKKYTSALTGIIEFKFHDKIREASFHKSAMLISPHEKSKSLEYIMGVGKLIHFNADILSCSCKEDVKILVTDIWMGKKGKKKKEKKNLSLPYKFEMPESLHHGPVYKATVTEIPNPFKFVAEVDNTTFKVLVYNDHFSPSAREPPLTEKDRVTSYVSIGDKVSLIVQKISSYSKHNWMATEAWLEDEDYELNNRQKQQKQKKKKGKNEEGSKIAGDKVLEGEVYRVESTWGMLLCKSENLVVVFHSKNLRLFGVPAEGIHLNHLKLLGETIHFVLEENPGASQTSTAQRAWLGSWESVCTQWDVIQHSMQLVEYCKDKNLDQQVTTHLAERIAGERSQFRKAEGNDGKEENSGEEPLLENISQGIFCLDTCSLTKAEELELSNTTNDEEACSIYNVNNTENESYTVDNTKETSPCRVTASIQEEDELTDEDIQILSAGVKGIIETQLSSVLSRLNIAGASSDMKLEVCNIMKNELTNIIEGDFLEHSLGISHTRSQRNVALSERNASDASCQTISTGPVMFWEVTTDL